MKPPSECASLGDVREAIDAIDAEIVALLGRRLPYVLTAARFKTDEDDVRAPERVAAMLAERRVWAMDAGLNPDFVASVFEVVIPWFVETQIAHFRKKKGLRHDG